MLSIISLAAGNAQHFISDFLRETGNRRTHPRFPFLPFAFPLRMVHTPSEPLVLCWMGISLVTEDLSPPASYSPKCQGRAPLGKAREGHKELVQLIFL